MAERPKHWPSDVTPVGVEDLDRLGINGRNELFWDGQRMITRSKIYLTFPQTMLAVLATIASLATIATGLNNASVFLCARDIHWLGCPAPPPSVPR